MQRDTINSWKSNLNSRCMHISHKFSATLSSSGFLCLLGPAENKINKRQAEKISIHINSGNTATLGFIFYVTRSLRQRSFVIKWLLSQRQTYDRVVIFIDFPTRIYYFRVIYFNITQYITLKKLKSLGY